jgi:hypothetical protein
VTLLFWELTTAEDLNTATPAPRASAAAAM